MHFRPVAAFLTAAALLAACSRQADAPTAAAAAAPLAAVKAPAGRSWTDVVAATPEGGMRIGNPDAPIKLVEYASFTCPHCKHFEDDAADPLQQKYVSTGKVSWEFRPVLIHGGIDVALILLTACRGPEPYFALTRQLFAAQETWFGQASIDRLNAQMPRIQALAPSDQFKAMVDATGLYPFFAARGLPRAQADACLADAKAIAALTATQERYSTKDNITSTPTMLLNGATWNAPAATSPLWPQLEAELKRRGA